MAHMTFVHSEILVIGSGIAGLGTAFDISTNGKQVLLVSKSSIGKSTNTRLAGGIFTFATGTFRIRDHFDKTLKTGRMMNDRALVDRFTQSAPAKVQDLLKRGLKVVYHDTGFRCLSDTLRGGAHLSSVLHRASRDGGVDFMEGVIVTDLLIANGECRGAVGFHKQTGQIFGILSRAVVLASGGAGSIYAQSNNAPGALGDGYALGLDAGLDLIDMEFVQFYPLVYAGSGRARMIVPSALADLGPILNRHGEEIKEKYHLHDVPVAAVSRDRLSQALFREAIRGNGIGQALFLNLRKADDSAMPMNEHVKRIYKRKISYDTKPVMIAPACHHTMGGVRVDPDGKTAIGGLFAVGEVASGFHGANRMGGNALTEALVFGDIVAGSARAYVDNCQSIPNLEKLARSTAAKRFTMSTAGKKPTNYSHLLKKLKSVLWEKVGIIRTEQTLFEAVQDLDELGTVIENARPGNAKELAGWVACRNVWLAGKAIAISALKREESRGAHFREDFPDEKEEWLRRIHVNLTDGKPQIDRVSRIT